jgi:hypothetical protein
MLELFQATEKNAYGYETAKLTTFAFNKFRSKFIVIRATFILPKVVAPTQSYQSVFKVGLFLKWSSFWERGWHSSQVSHFSSSCRPCAPSRPRAALKGRRGRRLSSATMDLGVNLTKIFTYSSLTNKQECWFLSKPFRSWTNDLKIFRL